MTKRNIALQVAYDGTNFFGYAIQPNLRTVQGEIERALEKFLGHDVKTHCAGRTDAGVHACTQVINFETTHPIPADKLFLVLNRALSREIRIIQSFEVPEDFHARYKATFRAYRYIISTAEFLTPFQRNSVWWYYLPFDRELFKTTWQNLTGEHNFEAFCTSGSHRKNFQIDVKETHYREQGDYIIFDIVAPNFVYNMIRALMGTIMGMARGQFPTDHLAQLLEQPQRDKIGTLAPPQGLYLYQVHYPKNYQIALKKIPIP